MRINKTKLYIQYFIKKIFCKTGISNFNYQLFSDGIEHYTLKLKSKNDLGFKFTGSSGPSDLYSTTYAIMLLGLLNKIDQLDKNSVWQFYLGDEDSCMIRLWSAK